MTASRILNWTAGAAMAVAAWFALTAPPDALQGIYARVIYVHVPAGWLAYLAFFFALAGIPPLAGWFAKFVMFRSVMGGGAGAWGAALAVIAAVNAVIALYYYARIVKTAFMDPVPATAPVERAAGIRTAPSLLLALGVTAAVVLIAGFMVLSQSPFTLNADMGLLTAITIGFALLADFLFLPPLLMKVEK